MTITPRTFHAIKEMYPALKYFFSEELDEIQKKVNYRMQPFEKTIEQNLEMDHACSKSKNTIFRSNPSNKR